MKYLVVIVIVVACAFGYHQFTKPSAHDTAIRYMKNSISTGNSDQFDSVTCTATAEPAYMLQTYGTMTMFNCSAVDADTGRILQQCIFTSGKPIDSIQGQGSIGTATMGGPTCAESAKEMQNG